MRLKEFLRLRRQQDAVKIIILYVIAIGVCCGFLIRDGLRYANAIRTKEEYKLTGSGTSLTESQVERVRTIDGVTNLSYDLTDSVTVYDQGKSASFEAELLSRDYIQDVYGIETESSMKTYYANDAAYNQIKQSLSQNLTPIQADEIQVRYISSVEESMDSNQSTGNSDNAGDSTRNKTRPSARVVRVDIGGNTPFVCAAGDPVTLRTSGSLRIQVARQDQSKKVLALAGNLSFSNDNTLEIYQAQSKLDQIFIRIKFELLLLIVCLVAAIALKKYAVRPLEK